MGCRGKGGKQAAMRRNEEIEKSWRRKYRFGVISKIGRCALEEGGRK